MCVHVDSKRLSAIFQPGFKKGRRERSQRRTFLGKDGRDKKSPHFILFCPFLSLCTRQTMIDL